MNYRNGQFGGGPVQELPPSMPPSLLQMAQGVPQMMPQMSGGGGGGQFGGGPDIAQGGGGGGGGAGPFSDPYGGRTMRQIVEGGGPEPGAGGAGWYGAGGQERSDPSADWGNQPATHEQVAAAVQRGGRYQPEFAKTVQSSGPEGGWFSIPGTQAESNVPWGMHDNSEEKNPAPGLFGMSTNNWRLLPRRYQDPRHAMRAGHIMDRYWMDKPLGYAEYHGGAATAPFLLGGPGHGFPTSIGSSNQRGYFFPGQIEPWVTEGGPGTT